MDFFLITYLNLNQPMLIIEDRPVIGLVKNSFSRFR